MSITAWLAPGSYPGCVMVGQASDYRIENRILYESLSPDEARILAASLLLHADAAEAMDKDPE